MWVNCNEWGKEGDGGGECLSIWESMLINILSKERNYYYSNCG